MFKKIPLKDFLILGAEQISPTAFELSGTYNDTSITVFTNGDFYKDCVIFYLERCITLDTEYFDADTPAEQYAYFYNIFSHWRSLNRDNIIRAFYALSLDYAPLDNYNGTETITTEYGKKDTRTLDLTDTDTHNTTDTTTYGKTDTRTPNLSEVTDNSIYGYNSATASPSDSSTRATTGTDTNALSGNDVLAKTGSNTLTKGGTDINEASGTDTVTTVKSGNLGVTTSQQMLNSEWELRKRQFVSEIIHAFINTVTIY